MSVLLKAGDDRTLAAVRPFRSAAAPDACQTRGATTLPTEVGCHEQEDQAVSQPEAVSNSQTIRIAQLERRIADLTEQSQNAAQEADERIEAAFQKGLKAGETAADTRAAQRIETLETGIGQARKSLVDRLEKMEIPALEVARTSLSRLLEDTSQYMPLVAQAIARQMRDIDAELVLSIHVSKEDFSDPVALANISQSHPGISVQCDPELPSGGCRIDLQLGRIDAGIPGQWQRLSTFLESLAQAEGAPR